MISVCANKVLREIIAGLFELLRVAAARSNPVGLGLLIATLGPYWKEESEQKPDRAP